MFNQLLSGKCDLFYQYQYSNSSYNTPPGGASKKTPELSAQVPDKYLYGYAKHFFFILGTCLRKMLSIYIVSF